MKSFGAIAAFVAAANAYAYSTYNTTSVAPPVYETTTVSSYTTVCAGPTTIPVNPSYTITVSEATTLTITDCPCTITYPVSKPTAVPSYTPIPAPPKPVYPSGNATAPVYPTGTAAPTKPSGVSPTEFPGSAGKAGLSLLAVGGALAAFL